MLAAKLARVVRLHGNDGLNLRLAAALSAQATRFPCKIRVSYQSRSADAKSVWELLSLIALPNSDILLEAAGPHSQEALDCLESIVSPQKA